MTTTVRFTVDSFVPKAVPSSVVLNVKVLFCLTLCKDNKDHLFSQTVNAQLQRLGPELLDDQQN